MGDIGNGVWMQNESGGWNCSKCPNDQPFVMPVEKGDATYLQVDLFPRYGAGARVCATHINTPSGRRLMSDVTQDRQNIFYGAQYYNETKTNGYNLYTFKVPPIACEYVPTYDPSLCMLDLGGHSFFGLSYTDWLNWGTDPAWNGAWVTVNGVTYDVKNNILPPGWSWNPGNYRRYLIFPCPNAATYNVRMRFKDANLNYLTSDVTLPFPVLPYSVDFCDCFITMTFENYVNSNRVVLNPGYGGQKTYTSAFSVMGAQYLPGVAPSSLYVGYIVGDAWYIKIPVRCGIDITVTRPVGPKNLKTNPPIERTNCTSYTVPTLVKCFQIEFEIDDGRGCGSVRLFSEPFQCPDCPEPTLVIRSDYGGQVDCLGQVQHFSDVIIGRTPAVTFATSTGLLDNFLNALRIPAVLRKLPSKLTLTKNEKCTSYRSRLTQRYELQGTKAFPPYFAQLVETVLAGKTLYINGERFELMTDTVFEPLKEKGVSAFGLRVVLEKCSCEVTFDC